MPAYGESSYPLTPFYMPPMPDSSTPDNPAVAAVNPIAAAIKDKQWRQSAAGDTARRFGYASRADYEAATGYPTDSTEEQPTDIAADSQTMDDLVVAAFHARSRSGRAQRKAEMFDAANRQAAEQSAAVTEQNHAGHNDLVDDLDDFWRNGIERTTAEAAEIRRAEEERARFTWDRSTPPMGEPA